jgi:transcriptional regulator with XRE-family HTH domain
MPQVPTVRPDGTAVRRIRKERGYTVTDFARKLGRHRQSIWNIEGPAEIFVSEVFMRQIATALKVDVSELIKQDDDDEPVTERAA